MEVVKNNTPEFVVLAVSRWRSPHVRIDREPQRFSKELCKFEGKDRRSIGRVID